MSKSTALLVLFIAIFDVINTKNDKPNYKDIQKMSLEDIKKKDPAVIDQWEKYKSKVKLPKKDEDKAKLNFARNAYYIDEFNKVKDSKVKLGINDYAHLSNEEYQSMLGTKVVVDMPKDLQNISTTTRSSQYDIDWRTQGYVSGVKDQGQCGSCYSFASVAAVEAVIRRTHDELYSLSEQDIIDCSLEYGNKGCNGGTIGASLTYVMKHGITNANHYNYEAKVGKCRHSEHDNIGNITTYLFVPVGDENKLAEYLFRFGTVAVAIDSSLETFRFYESGIYSSSECSSTNLNHGVAVVGSATTPEGSYWIVKNSWGYSWGNKGYIYIAKDQNNMCGIASNARVPIA